MPTTRGYTSQEEMPSICEINYNARLYDPTVGKFLSADTMVPDPYDAQSFNRYSYVNNNPPSFIDPSGHSDTGAASQCKGKTGLGMAGCNLQAPKCSYLGQTNCESDGNSGGGGDQDGYEYIPDSNPCWDCSGAGLTTDENGLPVPIATGRWGYAGIGVQDSSDPNAPTIWNWGHWWIPNYSFGTSTTLGLGWRVALGFEDVRRLLGCNPECLHSEIRIYLGGRVYFNFNGEPTPSLIAVSLPEGAVLVPSLGNLIMQIGGPEIPNFIPELTIDPPPDMTAAQFASAVISASESYNGDLPYTLPNRWLNSVATMAPGTYNSDSLTSGVLMYASGGSYYSGVENYVIGQGYQIPGWENPVPTSSFH